MTKRGPSAAAAALGFAAMLAGCQPLPHPFADDRPPAALLAVPDSIVITVASIAGEPRATAAKLSSAIASELLKHNITASAQTTSHTSYVLEGRIEEGAPRDGKATVTVFWRLRDAQGRTVDERSSHLSAAARDWQDGAEAPVGQLAAASAGALASLLTETTPKEQPAGGRVRVAIRKIGGAPGDGDTSLATSIAAVLKHADIDIVDQKTGKPDLDLDAEITVTPKADRQHVKIVWHVSHAGGGEVGTVAQENDVPRGQLDGAWGDVAYSVAIAAGGGIMQLVDRGTPPVKLGAATPPAEPPAEPPVGAGAPPAATTNPVPGNIGSPVVALPPISVAPANPYAPPDVPVLLPRRGVPLPPQ
jgi:hypothetical protein